MQFKFSAKAGFAAVASCLAMVASTSASAEQVTLRVKGGGFEVSGELKSFDGARYVIDTPVLGRMTLDAARFDCVGAACLTLGRSESAALNPAVGLPAGSANSVVISGSNTIGNQLMPALIEGYAAAAKLSVVRVAGADPLDLEFRLADAQKRPIGQVTVRRHGSSTAFKDLEKQAAQIGMSSRPIKPEEVQKLAAAGRGDLRTPASEHVLGLDGLVVVVSPENPAVSISLDNVAKIFAGEIKDWSELGLPAGKINTYAPTPDSGTYDTFESLVMKPRNAALQEATKRTEDHAQQSDWVAADPLGIGVVGIAYQRNAKMLNIESSCGLITRPTVFSMKTEEYPLTRRLYLYTSPNSTSTSARNLVNFALSPAAQAIVRRTDFVDQSPEVMPFKDQGARIAYAMNAPSEDFDLNMMRELLTDITPAERLTTTLHFETNATRLDAKATLDVARLAQVFGEEAYRNKRILIIGFADSRGGFDINLQLSRGRAEAVRRALFAVQPSAEFKRRVTAKGYSELAPVNCNDNDVGREFNRRVEIWIY